MNYIANIENCVASLEATQSILSHIYTVEQRTNLTETELALVRLNVKHAATQIGADSSSLIPSLESDNFFEATDVVASMEAIGEAIKSGAKAVWETIKAAFVKFKEWCKRAVNAVSNKYKSIRQAISNFEGKLEIDIPLTRFRKCGEDHFIAGLNAINQFVDILIRKDALNYKEIAETELDFINTFGGKSAVSRIGYDIKFSGEISDIIKPNFEPQSGDHTIVIKDRGLIHGLKNYANTAAKNVEAMLTIVTQNEKILADFDAIFPQEERDTSYKMGDDILKHTAENTAKAMRNSTKAQHKKQLLGIIYLQRSLLTLYGAIAGMISVAMNRSETGNMSSRNKHTSANKVDKDDSFVPASKGANAERIVGMQGREKNVPRLTTK